MVKNNLNIIKKGLVIDILMMVIFSIYGVWAIMHNHEFSYKEQLITLSTALQVKLILILLVTSTTILYPLWLMIKLIKNIEKSKIFNDENIKIMERIGLSLVIFALLCILGFSVEGSLGISRTYEFLNSKNELDIWGISINFSVLTVAILSVVSILIAMVEVFKEGLNLKEENDLTV